VVDVPTHTISLEHIAPTRIDNTPAHLLAGALASRIVVER
jgi:hypothetical protein